MEPHHLEGSRLSALMQLSGWGSQGGAHLKHLPLDQNDLVGCKAMASVDIQCHIACAFHPFLLIAGKLQVVKLASLR